MKVAKYMLLALVLSLLPVMAAGQTPSIELVPQLPDTFIIPLDSSVVVTLDVDHFSADLKGYSVTLWHNPAVVHIDSITEGFLLKSQGQPTFFESNYSPTQQYIYIDGAILGDGVSVDGAGTLAKLWFSSIDYGVCDLLFMDMQARDATNSPLIYDQLESWVRVCPLLGDANADHLVNITDAVYIIAWIFAGGPEPIPTQASGDVNCDALTNITDVVYIIYWIFAYGPPPCDICSNDM